MVNIYKLKLTVLQQEILRLLFIKAGMSLNARGVARPLGVSPPAVSKALPHLEKLGYVKVAKDRESKRLSIELNRDNRLVMGMKRADNLKQIYESGLADFLHEKFPGATVVLFGSYAFGEDTIHSDIDIAVVGAKEKDIELTQFDMMLERTIILQFYPSFREIHRNLRNNILSGIILEGAADL